MKIWFCKIGECYEGQLPKASDAPMRQAVSDAYERIVGTVPNFIFSGWGAELTEGERAVVENREPKLGDTEPIPKPASAELTDWLRTYSAELMRIARQVSNIGKPESDNNYGREAMRVLAAAETITDLERQLGELTANLETADRAVARNADLERQLALCEAANDKGRAALAEQQRVNEELRKAIRYAVRNLREVQPNANERVWARPVAEALERLSLIVITEPTAP